MRLTTYIRQILTIEYIKYFLIQKWNKNEVVTWRYRQLNMISYDLEKRRGKKDERRKVDKIGRIQSSRKIKFSSIRKFVDSANLRTASFSRYEERYILSVSCGVSSYYKTFSFSMSLSLSFSLPFLLELRYSVRCVLPQRSLKDDDLASPTKTAITRITDS